MATIKDITAKCKAGEIAEAYEIALLDWNAEPDNAWTQREVGWALYYFIKADVENKKKDAFYEHLDKLAELTLLDLNSDRLIYENVLWKIAEYVKGIQADDLASISELFNKIQDYRFAPSRPYSYLLQNCLKFEGWGQMVDFIEWWNLYNLLPEDYEQFQLENGRKVMSLAERVYIAYSKALIKLGDQERIAAFIPQLETLMETHPDMLYPGYFCGKLLIAQGAGRDEALEKVVPFVRKKVNEFWAWQLMSDIYRDEPQKQLACLLRAVHCKTQESFLGKIRIRLAELYINNQDLGRAKFHIDKVSTCYLQQGWKLPGQLQQWSWQNWLQATQPDGSDPFDYKPITDQMLFSELSECLAIVTYVDTKARRAALVYGMKQRTMAKYGHWSLTPKEGIVLKVKYTPEGENLNIISVEQAQGPFKLPFVKIVTGTVDKKSNNPFAFLKTGAEDIFLSPSIVSKYNLMGKEVVTIAAVYDFNKKKNEWNWSCISIKK